MRYFFWSLVMLVLMIWGGFPWPAAAATVSLSSDVTTLHVGDVFTVAVVSDTELANINAVESEVRFPSDLLEYVASDNSHSVLSLWVEPPTIREGNTIYFSGIAPHGFIQKDATIIVFTFKVINTGQADIALTNTKHLQNDGNGTETPTIERNLHISVREGASTIQMQTIDTELPEHFTPAVVIDSDLYENADTLVFSTTDKGSGLDHFEIKEGLFSTYKRATSPYQIKDTSRTQRIAIKAVDRTGNERIELFYPQNYELWYQQRQIIGGILIGWLLVLSVLFILFRKNWRQGRRSS